MKTLLITGLTGTLGPYVAQFFEQHHWQVKNWNHHDIDSLDTEMGAQFWSEVNPDAVCHLAMGDEKWAGWLAQQAKQEGIPMLFTSTAMVFDSSDNGPYTIQSHRSGNEDYGQYKIRCEDAIWDNNPDAIIARLGWQIGDTLGGNNMFEQLSKQHTEQGHIDASSEWVPATSRMRDTAETIYTLIESNTPGLYHIDSNATDKFSFYELVIRLARFHKLDWNVKENQDFIYDQRLIDGRIQVKSLSEWL